MPTSDPSSPPEQAGTQPLLCVSCCALRAGHHCSECGAALRPVERLTRNEIPIFIVAVKGRVALQLATHQHDGPTPEAIERASQQPRGDWGDQTCRTCDQIKVKAYDLLVSMVPS